MPNVNDDGSVHSSFVETFPGSAIAAEVRFWPYDGGRSRQVLRGAIRIIENSIFRKSAPCNTYFSSLSKGRSFDNIWSDPAFWINWDPRTGVKFWGFTSATRPMEITISGECLAIGNVWVACATIVHEMAHLGGAPGLDGSGSNAAERSLLHCGLAAAFNPGAIGDPRTYSPTDSSGVRYA